MSNHCFQRNIDEKRFHLLCRFNTIWYILICVNFCNSWLYFNFSALEDAQNMPLFAKLLKPDLSGFYVRSGNDPPKYPTELFLGNLNADQRRIMSATASMCTSNMATPQATIIQGPPGTGKSTTIAATVMQIIFRWKEIRPGNFSCFSQPLLFSISHMKNCMLKFQYVGLS